MLLKYHCGRTKGTKSLIPSRPLGSTSTQILVSNNILQEKEPEVLDNSLTLGVGQDSYKNMENLIVPRSVKGEKKPH